MTEEAREEMQQASWIVEDAATSGQAREEEAGSTVRLLGRILRLVEQLRAARRHGQSSDEKKTTQRAAAGPGVGSVWTAPPDGSLLPNAHWRVATQARLSVMAIAPGTACALQSRGGHSCQAVIGRTGIHPQLCDRGPARLRTHRCVQTTLGTRLRQAGAITDYERTVPELCEWMPDGTCREAIVDIAARWPTGLRTTVLDVTIRSPHAARYEGHTTSTVDLAESEKQRRYGESITPIAYTTYGRLGPRSLQGLEQLAADARWHTDSYEQQRGLVARWRLAMEKALIHSVADTMLLALGAAAAAGWQRHAGTAIGRKTARTEAAQAAAGGERISDAEGGRAASDEEAKSPGNS